MKRQIQNIVVLGLVAGMPGCASTKAYFVDRGHDALDIFTITIEQGIGVTAHAGPFSTGLGVMANGAGLDGGTFGSFKDAEYDMQLLVLGINGFQSPCQERQKKRGGAQFLCIQDPTAPYSFTFGSHDVNPYKSLPLDLYPPTWVKYPGITQFDLSVAFGVGPRVGFNLMELIDFLCGWTTVDILSDDICIKKLKTESNRLAGTDP